METAQLETTVLLITKEDSVQKAVSSTLEKAGFLVLAASTFEAALDLCRNAISPVKLAIVDSGAEETAGPGYLDSLRRAAPGLRTILMSSSAQPDALNLLQRRGRGGRVMRKPFRRAQLLGTVLDVMSEPLTFTA